MGSVGWRGCAADPRSTHSIDGDVALRVGTEIRRRRGSALLRFGMIRTVVALVAVPFVAGCPPTPQPTECNEDAPCADGEACVELQGQQVCARTCGVDNPCAVGGACVETQGIFTCVDVIGSAPLGASCSTDESCLSGACFNDAGDATCVAQCVENADCESGERCLIDGARKICVTPLDSRPRGATCESGRECLSGQCVVYDPLFQAQCVVGCDGGCPTATVCVDLDVGTDACVPVIFDGAPCTTERRCEGGICATDLDGSRLCTRTCDEGCPNTWFCIDDVDGNPICMPPLDSLPRGATCTDTRECVSGLCITFNDFEGQPFATTCTVACTEGCLDDEICWPNDEGEAVCGPVVP